MLIILEVYSHAFFWENVIIFPHRFHIQTVSFQHIGTCPAIDSR